MSNNLRIDEEIKHLLKLKSDETGISQYDLVNKYILEGLKKDKRSKSNMTIDEIRKLLDYDKPEGDDILERLCGIAICDEVTDSVEIKKNAYKRC